MELVIMAKDKFDIPKLQLDKNNFTVWKCKMRQYLILKEWESAIEPTGDVDAAIY